MKSEIRDSMRVDWDAPIPMDDGVRDPRDRPPDIFATVNTLHFDENKAPYLLVPIIPPDAT